jgi:hypothetical protein
MVPRLCLMTVSSSGNSSEVSRTSISGKHATRDRAVHLALTPMTEEQHGYTDLDLLKQVAAQGMISAQSIEKLLGRFVEQNPDFAKNQDIQLAIRHADVIKAQLMGVNGDRVFESADHDRYSDGRPVVSTVNAGDSERKYVWYADPEHPYNNAAPDHPGTVEVTDSQGRIFKLFVSGQDELGSYELGDEERDRA